MGPLTRVVPTALRKRVPALFRERGHTLATNPKNRYIAFEVRTCGRSIFTLYTSGKLVATLREGDAEGQALDDALAALLGQQRAEGHAPRGSTLAAPSAPWLAGLDETGTGEIIGSALVAGALFPRELQDDVDKLAGHVETKSSRTAGGWERLGEQLAGLRPEGLRLTLLPVPNRLFDRYSKNGLLDLTYVRAVCNLLADPGGRQGGLHLAIDDFGAGPLLRGAVSLWRGQGLDVSLQTKADDRYLAARTASVWARSARARELLGLGSEVSDGPLGSGNPGHRDTRAWLRRRARSDEPWPSFVKTSFSTVTRLSGLPPVEKQRVPALESLLGDRGAAGLAQGGLCLDELALPAADGSPLRSLNLDRRGVCVESLPAAPFLPLLFGGLVLDAVGGDLRRLDRLLDRERGLASGWRVLLGPDLDPQDPFTTSLLRAYRLGVIVLEPCAQSDPLERARVHGALCLLGPDASDCGCFHARLSADA